MALKYKPIQHHKGNRIQNLGQKENLKLHSVTRNDYNSTASATPHPRLKRGPGFLSLARHVLFTPLGHRNSYMFLYNYTIYIPSKLVQVYPTKIHLVLHIIKSKKMTARNPRKNRVFFCLRGLGVYNSYLLQIWALEDHLDVFLSYTEGTVLYR